MGKTLIAVCIAALALGKMAWGCAAPSGPCYAAANEATARANRPASWPICDSPTHPSHLSGVPNFGRLNSCIWRSGQPTRAGYQRLAAEGLKTVINLRKEFPQDRDLLPSGIRYVYIPVENDFPPTDEQASEFIATVSDPANWPVLVHCQAGEGRAGTMSALVRCSLDGWSPTRIMAEVANYRHRTWGFLPTPLAARQRKFLQHWEAMPAPSSEDKLTR